MLPYYCNRLVQKTMNKNVLSYENVWPLLTFLKGPEVGGDTFSPLLADSACPTVIGPARKTGSVTLCHYLFMAVSMVLNIPGMWHSSTLLLHAAFAADTILGDELEWTSSHYVWWVTILHIGRVRQDYADSKETGPEAAAAYCILCIRTGTWTHCRILHIMHTYRYINTRKRKKHSLQREMRCHLIRSYVPHRYTNSYHQQSIYRYRLVQAYPLPQICQVSNVHDDFCE